MPIHCVCPNGHALRVKDKLAGRAGRCPTCGAGFQVPELAAAAAPRVAAPPIPPGAPPPILARAATVPAPPPSEAVEWRLARPDGEQFGPTVPTVFAQWIAAGRVGPDSLVWRTGWAEWRRAAEAAAELPAPLPESAVPPPPGVTLPPPLPPATTPEPRGGASAPVASAYVARRRQQARLRRWATIGLAVLCVVLTALLAVLLSRETSTTP